MVRAMMTNENFRAVVEALREGVYITDMNRRIVYWSSSAERIAGYTFAETVGRSCNERILNHVDAQGRNLCRGLCPLAATLRHNARPTDVFGRWGGDKFAALIHHVDRDGLQETASRCRWLIESSFLFLNGASANVTVSVGGSLVRDNDTVESILERADRMLYEAKRAGRNRATMC